MAGGAVSDDLDSILSEQRSEILAAKTLGTDLDLAFHLQMQEAMNASLALCTQTSPSRPPSPSLTEVAATLDGGDDHNVLDLATTLILEDIERFAMERSDRERSEMEMRKTKEDLDLRFHDQNFANYLLNVPEEEWREYGDNYEKPYFTNGASSSAGGLLESECFRLYTMGLISDERIRDMVVKVAGLGVAICDSRDNVIFEVKKPLEAVAEGKELSDHCAELRALIEGLNHALNLELKRVNFFCADYMLFQYITGRVQPGGSTIATLVNEVILLQRRFTSCNPNLVARNQMKFVFKYARDAIVSQITWTAETSSKGKCLKETCIICYEDIASHQMFSIQGCHHRFCCTCMKQHVEVKLLHAMAAKCPNEGCESKVNIDSCKEFLEPRLIEVMGQRTKEASIPVSERVYCPYSRCSALMSKSEVLQYTLASFLGAEQCGARKCIKCSFFFCINCKAPWHYNMTCSDYKSSNPKRQAEDALLLSLATKQKWRQCIKCSHMVELSFGCYHITCRCGYEFCYTCGAPWKNKKQICRCPLWDERNIIRSDQRRR